MYVSKSTSLLSICGTASHISRPCTSMNSLMARNLINQQESHVHKSNSKTSALIVTARETNQNLLPKTEVRFFFYFNQIRIKTAK